jgi:DnaK suppressor protein
MTRKRAEFERTLRARREAVLASLVAPSETRAHLGRLADDDQAQVLQHESVSLELNNLDYGKLRLIEEALDRLESGDFGQCLSCEENIPDKRLKAVPWARYCVQCQEELDGLRRTGTADLFYDDGGSVR